jgi:hypothetical protein
MDGEDDLMKLITMISSSCWPGSGRSGGRPSTRTDKQGGTERNQKHSEQQNKTKQINKTQPGTTLLYLAEGQPNTNQINWAGHGQGRRETDGKTENGND